jgi:hypothetical protein
MPDMAEAVLLTNPSEAAGMSAYLWVWFPVLGGLLTATLLASRQLAQVLPRRVLCIGTVAQAVFPTAATSRMASVIRGWPENSEAALRWTTNMTTQSITRIP